MSALILLALATLVSGSAIPLQDTGVRTRLVTITVAGDPHHTLPHTIIIEAAEPGVVRTEAQRAARAWKATRTSARGVEEVTSETCPALQPVALSFSSLPNIPVEPAASRIHGDTEPVPPTRKDGFVTRLQFDTRTDDGSDARVEISGGNVYAGWGHDAVAALLRCWEPLIPQDDQPD